jgi:hypothetical protein
MEAWAQGLNSSRLFAALYAGELMSGPAGAPATFIV